MKPRQHRKVLTGFSVSDPLAAPRPLCQHSKMRGAMPISALLGRIRQLIPSGQDDHYDEIVRGFGLGTLHAPATPMTDQELAQAIADFLKDAPTSQAIGDLGRRLDPSTPL